VAVAAAAARALGALPLGASSAIAQPLCWPTLRIEDDTYAPMRPPTMARLWTARVMVDAPRCAADASGTFDIVFLREKENGLDHEFREHFAWRASSVPVEVEFWADETPALYWIDRVQPCACVR
jgi:hypothetical protein